MRARLIFSTILFITVVALAFTLAPTSVVVAASEFFTIESFDTNAVIYESGKVNIKETISVEYDSPRHGIFRVIPYKYPVSLGTSLKIRYKVNSVQDEKGDQYNYKISREGGNFTIKIGDADSLVSGKKIYMIDYDLERVISFFDDHDEFYFNVTGNGWPTTIAKATATIALPKEVSKEQLKLAAFTGIYGSADSFSCEGVKLSLISCVDSEVVDAKTVRFSAQNLDITENLTVVAGWPKGIVSPPSEWQKFLWFVADNWIFVTPILLPLIAFFVMMRLWNKYGRDPHGSGVVVVQFAPPDGFRPAEIGAFIDESVDMRDIVASMIDLASRGYLRIVEEQEGKFLHVRTTFKLIKLKAPDATLKKYEQMLLDSLFDGATEVTKSDLENKFYKDLADIKEAIYDELTRAGHFAANPNKARKQYSGIGGGLVFAAIILLWIGIGAVIWPVTLGLGLAGIVVLIFSKFMPKKTIEGIQAWEKVKGFEDFMNSAEKYRQKFAEDSNMFTDFIAYAIALNVVSKWANAFEGIYKGQPDWYSSSRPFDAIYFSHSLSNFSTSMGTAMASSPRSSASSGGSGLGGGGFSGGGFGGGGGGSW